MYSIFCALILKIFSEYLLCITFDKVHLTPRLPFSPRCVISRLSRLTRAFSVWFLALILQAAGERGVGAGVTASFGTAVTGTIGFFCQ